MPVKYTVTLTALGTSSVIVLPKPILDGFKLGKGHKLDLIVRDDGIYIPLTEQSAYDNLEDSINSSNQEEE
ncbi:MAG TPA: AbrB/MazE/SpoVT family DNA-binding domain-containing protein [Nitrososphaeraceae archaeon]|nr:AbrB/MazE/SpoVT family DNA-binding domain-containing protein [Nitrososphaeraceae archaeon]